MDCLFTLVLLKIIDKLIQKTNMNSIVTFRTEISFE